MEKVYQVYISPFAMVFIWLFQRNVALEIFWKSNGKSVSGLENISDLLMKSGGNVNWQNIYGKTPLHMAAERGQLRLTNLIEYNEWKELVSGYVKIADLLVQNGANVNLMDADGLTALQYAINNG